MTRIHSIQPTEVIGGKSKLKITGDGFGDQQLDNYVTFIDNEGHLEYLSPEIARTFKCKWSNTEIEVEMPNCAGSNSPVRLVIAGNTYDSTQPLKVKVNTADFYLIDRNGLGGYTFRMHETFYNIPDAKKAIEEVFEYLRKVTGVNFILSDKPTTLTENKDLNECLIIPYDKVNLAECFYHNWNHPDYKYIKAMDIRINSANWDLYYGTDKTPEGKLRFRYTLMHELGHAVGLGHVTELCQTMHPVVHLLPAECWNEREHYTKEEVTAMKDLVLRSQSKVWNNGIKSMTMINQ